MNINKNWCILVFVLLLLISVCRYYGSKGGSLSKESLLITIVMVFTGALFFIFCKSGNRSQDGNYLKIGTIFVLGYIIVHFFNYLAFLLSEIDYLAGYGYYRELIVNEAAINSSSSLIAFMLGYVLNNKPFKCKRNVKYDVGIKLDYIALFFFALFFITIDKRYFNGGYGELVNNGGVSAISSVSQNFLIASIIGSSCSKVYLYNSISFKKYVYCYSVLFYVVVIPYMILVMSSGDRGPLIQIGMCYFSIFFLINRSKTSFTKLFIPMIIAVFCLFFLGKVRSIEGNFSLNKIDATKELIDDELGRRSLVFAATYELSGVVRSYHALYDYTEKNGTFHGFGFFDQILGFIPGLRPFVIYPLLGMENADKYNTNLLSSAILQRDDAGMGTTCCADTYINFGFEGTMIVFFIIGILFKKLDLELYNTKHNLCVFVFAVNYLILAIYLGRGKFSSPLTFSIYSYLLIYFVSSWNTFLTKKRM